MGNFCDIPETLDEKQNIKKHTDNCKFCNPVKSSVDDYAQDKKIMHGRLGLIQPVNVFVPQ